MFILHAHFAGQSSENFYALFIIRFKLKCAIIPTVQCSAATATTTTIVITTNTTNDKMRIQDTKQQ